MIRAQQIVLLYQEAHSLGIKLSGLFCCCVITAGCAHPNERGADARIYPDPPRVTTWKASQFRSVERQANDYSCGAAALATLAKYFLSQESSEIEIVNIVRSFHDDESWKVVQANGLRLLDLRNAATKLGLEAQGYRLSLRDLSGLKGPAIIHLDKDGYKHFSVFKGILRDRVWLADPIRGNIRLPVHDFLKEWTGVVLLVWDPSQPVAREHQLTIIDPGTPAEYDAARSALYVRPPEALILR